MSEKSRKDSENVKVVVRCRPPNSVEIENNDVSIVTVNAKTGLVSVAKPESEGELKHYTFDCAFPPGTAQIDLYNQTARSIVDSVINGYNGTIFAYGQTGTGKTFTMEGVSDDTNLRGITPNSFHYIMEAVGAANTNTEFLVRVSFLEIYRDDVFDLLSKQGRVKMEVKESKDRGVFVKDLAVYNVKSVTDMMKVMNVGQKARKVGATKMNEGSSRSHSIFTVTIETCITNQEDGTSHIKVGKLNLVDLAGSERQKKTEASGERLEEAKSINWSLTVLGNCIKALVEPNSKHVPYRDSKLTRLLQDSLGGNTKTVMIANIGPASSNYDETLSTLRYADRAKNIKNKPTINEDPKDAMLRSMQDEIAQLKAALEARLSSGGGGGGAGGGGSINPKLAALLQGQMNGGVMTIYANGDGDGETMIDTSQLPQDIIEEKIVEKLIIQDTGIKEEDLKNLEEKAKQEQERLLSQTESEKQQMKEGTVLAEQAVKTYEEHLKQKELLLMSEGEQLNRLQDLLMNKEKQLLQGGAELDKALTQKLELKKTEEELRLRLEVQEKLQKELQEAEEAELYMNQHYNSTQEELKNKTDKLKKLWNKYQEKRKDLEELSEEFNQEREDLIDTIRNLDRQLKLKNVLIDSFMPPQYAAMIESYAQYDSINDQWIIQGIEFAGNNVMRTGLAQLDDSRATTPMDGHRSVRTRRSHASPVGAMMIMPNHNNPNFEPIMLHPNDFNLHMGAAGGHQPRNQFFSYANYKT